MFEKEFISKVIETISEKDNHTKADKDLPKEDNPKDKNSNGDTTCKEFDNDIER